MNKFLFLFLCVPALCFAGLDDRTHESLRLELSENIVNSLRDNGVCKTKQECIDNHIMQIDINGKYINIEIWSDREVEYISNVINECVGFYYKKNKYFSIKIKVFSKAKHGDISEILIKPTINFQIEGI